MVFVRGLMGVPAQMVDGQVEADIGAAKRVLLLEAEALRALANGLDGVFASVVEVLAAVRGRVIVSGMGKSGHVARKIAATLASTGTPAHFVHPAEASHGDLGMIAAGDAVICLSNSGETQELTDLVAHARRFAIPLVAIVGRARSTMGDAADLTLVLPDVPEACPLGLAPTTSTTAMLALGDALAVALLSRKGFKAADFQVLHPGGKLGRTLLRVRDLWHAEAEVPLVARGTAMREALLVMTGKRFGCVGIVDGDGRLIGIVTDGDLRRNMGAALLDSLVEQVMTSNPQTIRPDALAAEALAQMNAHNITALFAVADGRPLGIVHVHDCLRAGVA